MKQLTLAGHPVHPQVIAFPIGLFPFAAAMDAMYLATGKRSYADAAYYSLVGGLVSSLLVATTGAADYVTIPPGGQMKRMANTHAILNGSIVAIETANLVSRHRRRPGITQLVLGLLGTVGLIISQWYGGELVYKLGMRVRPAEQAPHPQAKPPGDDRLVRGFERLGEMMPAGGPASEG